LTLFFFVTKVNLVSCTEMFKSFAGLS